MNAENRYDNLYVIRHQIRDGDSSNFAHAPTSAMTKSAVSKVSQIFITSATLFALFLYSKVSNLYLIKKKRKSRLLSNDIQTITKQIRAFVPRVLWPEETRLDFNNTMMWLVKQTIHFLVPDFRIIGKKPWVENLSRVHTKLCKTISIRRATGRCLAGAQRQPTERPLGCFDFMTTVIL